MDGDLIDNPQVSQEDAVIIIFILSESDDLAVTLPVVFKIEFCADKTAGR